MNLFKKLFAKAERGKPAQEKAWTEKLWIYDLRTNKHFTLKENTLKRSDLDDFVGCYFGAPTEDEQGKEEKRLTVWLYPAEDRIQQAREQVLKCGLQPEKHEKALCVRKPAKEESGDYEWLMATLKQLGAVPVTE